MLAFMYDWQCKLVSKKSAYCVYANKTHDLITIESRDYAHPPLCMLALGKSGEGPFPNSKM